MTNRELMQAAQTRLEAAGDMDAAADAEWLMCACLDCKRSALRFYGELNAACAAEYEAMVSRRAEGEPLQYILGDQPFMGYTFKADPRALIPRSETEELCMKALELLRRTPRPRVLDVGTGTGALAVSIKLERPDARVTAVDISPDALALAGENARALGADVELLQGSMYAPVAGRRFDMIVSNPPYIPTAELADLQREVQREPMLALDGGADGLDFYRALSAGAPDMLERGGWIAFEVGQGQAQAVGDMLAAAGLDDVQICIDINGVERMVCARRA